MELGAEPVHVLVHNSNNEFKAEIQELCSNNEYGQGATFYPGKDLWHMRSLLFTEPVDFMIGNSYGKYLERDTKIPLIRIGYPIMDRHNLHRYSTIGYQGTINLLTWIVNAIFEEIDRNTNIPSKTDISFDLIRQKLNLLGSRAF